MPRFGKMIRDFILLNPLTPKNLAKSWEDDNFDLTNPDQGPGVGSAWSKLNAKIGFNTHTPPPQTFGFLPGNLGDWNTNINPYQINSIRNTSPFILHP